MKLLINMLRSESATVIAKASDAPTYKSLLRTLESVAPKAAIRVMACGKRKHGIIDAGVFVGTKNSEGAYYLVGSAAFALAMAEDFKSVAKKAKTEGKFIVWEATDDGLPGKSPVNVVAYSKWADALADFVGRGDGTAGASAAPIIKEAPVDMSYDGIVAKILELEPDGYGDKADIYLNRAFGTADLVFNAADNGADEAISIDSHREDDVWLLIATTSSAPSLARTLGVAAKDATFVATIVGGMSGDNPSLVAKFSSSKAAAGISEYVKMYFADELPKQSKAPSAPTAKGPISLDDMEIEATVGQFNVSVDEKGIKTMRVNSDIALTETDLSWLHDEIGVVDSDKIGDKLNTSKQIAQFIWRAPAKDTVRDYLYSIENVGGSKAVVVESLPEARSNKARTRLVLVTHTDVPKKIKPLMKAAKVAIFSVKVNSSGAIQGAPTRVYAARNLREGLQAMLYFVKETKAQAK